MKKKLTNGTVLKEVQKDPESLEVQGKITTKFLKDNLKQPYKTRKQGKETKQRKHQKRQKMNFC